MIFNGYTPSTLLPVLLICAALIAILYLLRVRRRAVQVSHLGLWRDVVTTSHRRWHDWLRRLISFLILMAVLGLIALALMDPRPNDDDTATRHAVIIIDASASMAASAGSDDHCASRIECALNDAHQLVDHMTPNDRAVIIEASGIVSAVSGPFQADKSALHKAISQIHPRATSTDIQKALKLAASLTHGSPKPEIILLTDGQFDDTPALHDILPDNAAFQQKTYGTPTGNVAIEAFNVRRYIANRLGFEVLFKVRNDFDVPVTLKITLSGLASDENTFDPNREHPVIAQKNITVASGSSELRLYENLTLTSSRMVASIHIEDPQNLNDPMPLDDLAYARIPDFSKPRILAVTTDNLYLEAALLLNENYQVSFLRAPPSPVDLGTFTAQHDIVILDNSSQKLHDVDTRDWSGKAIFINPDQTWSPFPTKTVHNPIVERVNTKHPVARWLSLKNLNITQASVFKNIPNADLVVRAIEGPIMATHTSDTQKFLAIGFSLTQSDLIFRVALPVLIINAVDWLMNENAEPQRGFPTGTSWHIPIPTRRTHVDIVHPDLHVTAGIPVHDDTATLYGDTAGFYQIPDIHPPVEFAANLNDSRESCLSSTPTRLPDQNSVSLKDAPDTPQTSPFLALLEKLPASSQYLWVLALLIALAILAIEWLTFHRRWTV